MAFWEAIQNVDVLANTKIDIMPSIGFEGAAHPIFGTDWARLVVDHAIKRGLGMTSFWSMNRDAMLQDNQGVSKQYNDFVTAMKSADFYDNYTYFDIIMHKYGNDCSGFVSFAWGTSRKTTANSKVYVYEQTPYPAIYTNWTYTTMANDGYMPFTEK